MNFKHFGTIALVCLGVVLSACNGAKSDDPGKKDDPGKQDDDIEGDIEVVDGKVTFYVFVDENSPVKKAGYEHKGNKVNVNGKDYTVEKDNKGRKFIVVNASANNSYAAYLTSSSSKDFFGTSANNDVKVPYSQFYATNILRDFPMYCAYSKQTGKKLIFKDAFAMLDLNLKGSAAIASVKVSNSGNLPMGGIVNYLPSKQQFSVVSAVPFAVLNCTNEGKGVTLADGGTHFRVVLLPGNYSGGIDVTVCTMDHRVMRFNVTAGTVKGNDVIAVNKDFTPDEGVVFYDGFDTMVWGGNYVGGADAVSFAPSDAAMDVNSGTELTGSENAFTLVAHDNPGSGFIQSNTWDEVSGKTVAASHQMSAAYIASRNISDYTYLFRTQEYQGCVAVGSGNTGRGIIQTPSFTAFKGVGTLELSFDCCLKAGFDDNLLIDIINGGYIRNVTMDGNELSLQTKSYTGITSMAVAANKSLVIPVSAAEKKQWHRIVVTVDRATSGTYLYLAGQNTTNGNHGIFVDEICARQVDQMARGTLRVLYWNIQNGMWADQHNNYDNFVKWVKIYDPDVCVWCESVTIYKDKTSSGIGNSGGNYKGYLPAGWPELAARYGHKYTAIGGTRDNYPQTVTAKFPIETLMKVTNGESSSKPIAHGAGLHKITVNGTDILIATLHTWPQAYGYGVPSSGQEDSKARNEGDLYREYEMGYVVKNVINNSQYASYQNKLFMGDFNSHSRVDNWKYKYDEKSTKLLCQDQILNNSDLVDIIAGRYPGDFMASAGESSRIDYMYASPSMFGKVKNAMILVDEWTTTKASPYVTSFRDPSDHRPVMVDFEF